MHRLLSLLPRILLASAILLCSSVARAQAEDPKTFEVGGFTFARPEQWQWVPVTSPMRKAHLKIGEDPAAEITFFHFGAQGGDVKSNTDRWLAQFKSKPDAEKIETKEVNGTKVTTVTTEGTFSSGMPGGPTSPMTDYALHGAILEGAEGSVFVKLVGPEAKVKAAREQFVSFIDAATKSRK